MIVDTSAVVAILRGDDGAPSRGDPSLLFKGDDFTHTDLIAAV